MHSFSYSCERKKCWLNTWFFFYFIPLDPNSHSEYGSGSTDPNECRSDWIRIHIPAFCTLLHIIRDTGTINNNSTFPLVMVWKVLPLVSCKIYGNTGRRFVYNHYHLLPDWMKCKIVFQLKLYIRQGQLCLKEGQHEQWKYKL